MEAEEEHALRIDVGRRTHGQGRQVADPVPLHVFDDPGVHPGFHRADHVLLRGHDDDVPVLDEGVVPGQTGELEQVEVDPSRLDPVEGGQIAGPGPRAQLAAALRRKAVGTDQLDVAPRALEQQALHLADHLIDPKHAVGDRRAGLLNETGDGDREPAQGAQLRRDPSVEEAGAAGAVDRRADLPEPARPGLDAARPRDEQSPLDEDPDLHRLLRAGHLDQEPVPRAHEILAALKDLRGRVDPDQGLGQPLLGVSGRVLHLDLGLLGAGGNPDRHGLLAPDRR